MSYERRIAIIGAGIGGLTAALALRQFGFEIDIYERSKKLREIGAGIQLSPNASYCLIKLGLKSHLNKYAVKPDALEVRKAKTGRLLSSNKLSNVNLQQDNAPFWVIHRSDLQQVLVDAAISEGVRLHLNSECHDAHETEHSIRPLLKNSNDTQAAAALIAADGVWSSLRQSLLSAPPALYMGSVVWRATLPIEQVPQNINPLSIGLWLGEGAHLVHYPIKAGRLFNIVAAIRISNTSPSIEKEWNTQGFSQQLLDYYQNWAKPARELLSQPKEWQKWPLYGVNSKHHRWTSGRIAFLGDAAHAMLPFMAQGGAMAIEDAIILANELNKAFTTQDMSINAALSSYAAKRQKRIRRISQAAIRNDRIFHLREPFATFRDYIIKAVMDGTDLPPHHRWIYDWRG